MAAITFLQRTSDGSTQATTHTFSGQNLGTASADRIIFVLVHAEDFAGGGNDISSVTVAGVTATLAAKQYEAGNGDSVGIFYANVPTGTSGTIVVTFSIAITECLIGVYLATGIGTAPTPFATASDANKLDPLNLNLNVPEQGIVLGAGTFENDVNAVTTTGLTENYDQSINAPDGASRAVGGCIGPIAAETPRTITFDDGSGGNAAGVSASFSAVASTADNFPLGGLMGGGGYLSRTRLLPT